MFLMIEALYVVIVLFLFLMVKLMNAYLFPLLGIATDKVWILYLITTDLVMTAATQLFIFDDPTGGFDPMLTESKMISFFIVLVLLTGLKMSKWVSISNDTFLITLATAGIALTILKYIIRKHLSTKHSENVQREWEETNEKRAVIESI